MNRKSKIAACLLGYRLWLGAPTLVQANDTMAMFGAGGLQFQKTNELRMTSEDLYISPREVRVSYTFNNLTDHDVSGTVAFPMPEVNVSQMSETPHKFHPSYLEGDIFDFHVIVGGQLIKPQADIHAFVKNADGSEKDVTELLRKYGLPVIEAGPFDDSLGADATRALVAAGVLMDEPDHHPAWSVRTTFLWKQIFPAGRSIFIQHRYKPVIGSQHMSTEISVDDARKYFEPWCTDRAFASSVKTLPADSNNMLEGVTVEYILKTGANWAGPISSFNLEIDKDGADLVSLCPIPGLKLERRGNSFVAKAAQYVPTADIKLLFVYRACDKSPCLKEYWPGYPR